MRLDGARLGQVAAGRVEVASFRREQGHAEQGVHVLVVLRERVLESLARALPIAALQGHVGEERLALGLQRRIRGLQLCDQIPDLGVLFLLEQRAAERRKPVARRDAIGACCAQFILGAGGVARVEQDLGTQQLGLAVLVVGLERILRLDER